jgi:type IV pilus assembly protein PilC
LTAEADRSYSGGAMAEFVWEARGRAGETKKGTMEAENEAAVHARLRSQQLSPVKVKKKGLDLSAIQIGSGVDPKDLVKFIRQFATMIDAGLPLVQCLDILAGQEPNKFFAAALRDIKSTVEQGATFSDALRKHPKIFDELFVNLVQAGEVGGILDTILNRLAVYIEKNVKLARQVRGAMAYPLAVIVIMIIVMIVLMTFVIPAFEGMFAEFGAKDALPTLTKYVIAASKGFVTYLPVTTVVSIGGFVLGTYFYRSKQGKRLVHRLILKLPIMGPVLQKIAVARFTRTLGTLLASGVPILDALDIVAKTAGNVIVEEGLLYARARISEGKNMAEPLQEIAVFPGMVVQMVAVGEQTGALDTMLNKIADFYEEEVDVAVSALTSLIEPVLMVVVGAMIGVVLISMYLPIFDLAGKIKAE